MIGAVGLSALVQEPRTSIAVRAPPTIRTHRIKVPSLWLWLPCCYLSLLCSPRTAEGSKLPAANRDGRPLIEEVERDLITPHVVARTLHLILFAAFLGACADDTTAPTPLSIEIEGDNQSDTVNAVLPEPMVLTIYGPDGTPAAFTPIHLESIRIPRPDGSGSSYPLGLASTPSQDPRPILTRDTDAVGQIKLFVRFEHIAGVAPLVVTSPTLGVSDTATFVIQPGSPTTLATHPGDTLVRVGASFSTSITIRDRHGNVGSGIPSWEQAGSATMRTGDQILAEAPGLDTYRISVGPITATMDVTVVPDGTITATRTRTHTGDTTGVAMFDLDLSNPYYLTSSQGGAWGAGDAGWSPDGSLVAYSGVGYHSNLFTLTTFGELRRIFSRGEHGLESAETPAFSHDGEWIFFMGVPEAQNGEIWRIRPDGSGALRVGSPALWWEKDTWPAPSPDGNRLTFASNRANRHSGAFDIRVLDLTSGAIATIHPSGTSPRWSPKTDSIAFVDSGMIWMTSEAGNGPRPVSTIRDVQPGIDWSPDARWLVAKAGQGPTQTLVVVEVATGLTIRIPGTSAFFRPSWRP